MPLWGIGPWGTSPWGIGTTGFVSAQAITIDTVRVTLDASPGDVTLGPHGAANPANWAFVRQVSGTDSAAHVVPVSVTQVSAAVFDVTGHWAFTPGMTYDVVANSQEDGGITGIASSPYNRASFVAVTPASPPGRDFDVLTMVPLINRREDDSRDLERFLKILRDPLLLHLDSVDRWTDILDIDLAPEDFLDLILRDLGYPFDIALTEINKRRAATVLVNMYREKGTVPGIKDAIRFFLGYECDVVYLNRALFGAVLGFMELGTTAILGGAPSSALVGADVYAIVNAPYSFIVKIAKPSAAALTASEASIANQICSYVKNANEQIHSIVSALPAPATITATPNAAPGQIDLTWAAVTGATDYTVFWSPRPDVSAVGPLGTTGIVGTSASVTGLTSSLTYYFTVCARAAGSHGLPAQIVTAVAG